MPRKDKEDNKMKKLFEMLKNVGEVLPDLSLNVYKTIIIPCYTHSNDVSLSYCEIYIWNTS